MEHINKFRVTTTQITTGSTYQARGGSIMFYNGSTTDTIVINGFPILPQSVLTDDANQNEMNITIYTITYTGTDRKLIIREKIFVS